MSKIRGFRQLSTHGSKPITEFNSKQNGILWAASDVYFCCKSTSWFWKLSLFLATIWLYHVNDSLDFKKVPLSWIIEAEWTNYRPFGHKHLGYPVTRDINVCSTWLFLVRVVNPMAYKKHCQDPWLCLFARCFCVKIPLRIQAPFVTRKYERGLKTAFRSPKTRCFFLKGILKSWNLQIENEADRLKRVFIPTMSWRVGVLTRTRMTNVMYLVKLFGVGLQGKTRHTSSGSELTNEAEDYLRYYC